MIDNKKLTLDEIQKRSVERATSAARIRKEMHERMARAAEKESEIILKKK